jgi:hypothetical protein
MSAHENQTPAEQYSSSLLLLAANNGEAYAMIKTTGIVHALNHAVSQATRDIRGWDDRWPFGLSYRERQHAARDARRSLKAGWEVENSRKPGVEVRSNRHLRQYKTRDEVPATVLADQFDHLDPEMDGADHFIHYRGFWYHISDFLKGGIEGWDSSHGESAWSGKVLNVSRDCETYQIGSFYIRG